MTEWPTGPSTFAVVSGGGTAGHVYPALAVAEGLVARGHDPSSIRYVGAERGVEATLVPRTGLPLTVLDVTGIQRRLSPRDLGRNVVVVPKMIKAVLAAYRLLRRWRPKVVVSVGGYASLPAAVAARLLRVPVVVVSWDRRPGWASTFTSRWAVACAVAFEESPLPRAVVTGAPVRRIVIDVDRARDRPAARARLGVDDTRYLVAVMGGSQGSGVLNDVIATYVDTHLDDFNLAVYHIVGNRFVASAGPARDGTDGVWYRPVGFDERIDQVYAAADVIVGRGGAGTVADVAVTGTPAVLVPWAGAAEDHQRLNVAWLTDAGAAIGVPESAVATVASCLDRLRAHPDERMALGANAAALGAPSRRAEVAALVERVALP